MAAGRLRVGMVVTPGMVFSDDWARAALTVADVVRIDVCRRSPSPTAGPFPSVWVPSVTFRPRRLADPLNHRVIAARIAKAVQDVTRDDGPLDLLHCHTYIRSGFVPQAARALGLPFVITEHSTRLTGENVATKQSSPAGRRRASHLYGQAGAIIAVSRYLAGKLAPLVGQRTIEVIGNPIDTSVFHPPTERPARPPTFVSVGRLAPEKRFDLLIDAFSLARRQVPGLTLEIIGDGPRRGRLEEMASRPDLRGSVVLTGRLSRRDVAEHLRSATGFVLVSQEETFCVAAIEALACGVPVVMPDRGPLPELVDHSSGLLVEPGNANAIAAAMVAVARGSLAVDGATLARQVHSRFSFDAIGARLDGVYRGVIERAGVP